MDNVVIDIDIEDMEQSSTSNVENAVSALRSRDTYGAATLANYTSGAFNHIQKPQYSKMTSTLPVSFQAT